MVYTIISGTNRAGSNTYKIAWQYRQLFNKKGLEVQFLSLEGINPLAKDGRFEKLEKDLLIPTDKFIFVSPEYNGSIPGILKLVIDSADWKKAWRDKKAMLVGVSTGRAGNLRGMDHLVSILHHMNIHVMPRMVPISQVDKLLNGHDEVTDESILDVMDQQVEEFVTF
jgi:chromate reductase, NAD(P)H dehydrogenase (quinone)